MYFVWWTAESRLGLDRGNVAVAAVALAASASRAVDRGPADTGSADTRALHQSRTRSARGPSRTQSLLAHGFLTFKYEFNFSLIQSRDSNFYKDSS